MMLIVPPIAIVGVFYGRYVRDLSKKTQTALGEITKVAEERIGNIRTVQAFARKRMPRSRGTRCSSAASSSWLRRRYSISISLPFVSSLFHSGPISNLTLSVDDSAQVLASGLFFGGIDHSGNLSILAVLWYGGSMVMHGASTQ